VSKRAKSSFENGVSKANAHNVIGFEYGFEEGFERTQNSVGLGCVLSNWKVEQAKSDYSIGPAKSDYGIGQAKSNHSVGRARSNLKVGQVKAMIST